MIIYIDKKTKRIKMRSQEKMNLPQFDIKEVPDENLTGRVSFFRNGKIESDIIDSKMKNEAIREEVASAKSLDDLKVIINKLI